MSARDTLAAALSAVEGVTADPFYVQELTPGHAMIRLDRVEYPNKFGGVAFWEVVVLLPQDLAEAERMIATIAQPVREALAPHVVLTGYRPEMLAIPGVGNLPCVVWTGNREEDTE